MDYTQGRYNVYDEWGNWIGRIDGDEFVRTPGANGQLLYRLEEDEFYDMNGGFIGHISNGQVVVAGVKRFVILAE